MHMLLYPEDQAKPLLLSLCSCNHSLSKVEMGGTEESELSLEKRMMATPHRGLAGTSS